MTNAELIRAIRTEIERLKTIQLKRIQEGDLVDAEPYDKNEAYNELLSFLDTLESEKPMEQNAELNEEIKKEMVKLPFFIRGKDQIAFARHFAQWGAKHLADDSKTSPNDLEEAAEKYSKERAEGHILYDWVHAFIAGAKWQKEQDEKEQADLFTIVALDAAQRAKEQMMKSAVEGEVCIPNVWGEHKEGNELVVRAEISKELGFKFGDKVRIIIVKEAKK